MAYPGAPAWGDINHDGFVDLVVKDPVDLKIYLKVQVRTNLTGTMEFSDAFTGNQAVRFYRVVAP